MAVNSVEIAIIHSVFKMASTVVLLPFTKQLIKLARFTVRSGPEEEKIQLLDDRFLNTPSVAVARCRELTTTMAEMSKDTFSKAFELVGNYSESEAKIIQDQEKEIDLYEDKLGTYMVKLSSKSVNISDSHEISKLLHCIGDFERISDHAVNILSSAEELYQKSIMFSDTALEDLKIMYAAVTEALDLATKSFENNDVELASRVEPLEQVVDLLKGQLKSRHIARLQRGECTTMLGFVFSDLITNLERIADHCSNIAVCVIQVNNNTFDTHSYLNTLKSSDNERYEKLYVEYINKYMLE
jgi:phosphate:Na+ symporter